MDYLFIILAEPSTNWFKFSVELASLGMGIFVSGITIYTFYLRFLSKKVKFFSLQQNLHRFHGDKITFNLENQSLSPISIESIDLVINNQYKLTLIKYSPFLLLRPFHTEQITSEEVSAYFTMEGERIDLIDKTMLPNNLFLILNTTRNKKIFVKIRGKIEKNKKGDGYIAINTSKDTFNDIIYQETSVYALMYKISGEEAKTIFIDCTGFMSESVFNFNTIDLRRLSSEDKVHSFFKELFTPLKIPFTITKLHHTRPSR